MPGLWQPRQKDKESIGGMDPSGEVLLRGLQVHRIPCIRAGSGRRRRGQPDTVAEWIRQDSAEPLFQERLFSKDQQWPSNLVSRCDLASNPIPLIFSNCQELDTVDLGISAFVDNLADRSCRGFCP